MPSATATSSIYATANRGLMAADHLHRAGIDAGSVAGGNAAWQARPTFGFAALR